MHLPLSDRLEEIEFSNKIQGSGDSANEDSGECFVYLLYPTCALGHLQKKVMTIKYSSSLLKLATRCEAFVGRVRSCMRLFTPSVQRLYCLVVRRACDS